MTIQGVNLHLHPVPPRALKAPVAAVPVQQAQPTRALEHKLDWLKPLVAGRVRSGINRGEGFDEVSSVRSDPHQQGASLKLYCRSADCVEAATGISRGQILDVKA